jgi:ribonucleoside-diphosphate reductase alpha chain
MRDASYLRRSNWRKSAAAFPLFNADMYLSGGNFASRLPPKSRTPSASTACAIRTCCRSRPPAPSAGLRRQRQQRHRAAVLLDLHAQKAHGRRHLQGIRGRGLRLAHVQAPRGRCHQTADYFVTALEISAQAHKDMVAAVAPFVDTSISKTVNVPADYPYAEFEDLYMSAWKAGLKGLATYRPNSDPGQRAVGRCAATTEDKKQPHDVTIDSANRACPSAPCPHPCCPACAGPAARA